MKYAIHNAAGTTTAAAAATTTTITTSFSYCQVRPGLPKDSLRGSLVQNDFPYNIYYIYSGLAQAIQNQSQIDIFNIFLTKLIKSV